MPKTIAPTAPRLSRRPPLPRTFSSPLFPERLAVRLGQKMERITVDLDAFDAMTYRGSARKRRLDELMAKIDRLPPARRKRLGTLAREVVAKFEAEDRRDPELGVGIRNDALWPPSLGGTSRG